MRDVKVIAEYRNGKLSGEVSEGGILYTIEPFDFDDKSDREEALLDRLDVLLVEWQFEKEMGGSQ